MRTMQTALTAIYAAALVMMPMVTTRADELGEKGREILKRYQRAVVTVQVVLKNNVSIGGMGSQSISRVTFDGKGGAAPAERWDVGKQIRDIAVAPDGTVWVVENGNPGGLYKLTAK